jgi:hypothetical protein
VDASAAPILEIGAILLAAAAGGWLARRVGLPVTSVAVSIGVSSVAVRLVPRMIGGSTGGVPRAT